MMKTLNIIKKIFLFLFKIVRWSIALPIDIVMVVFMSIGLILFALSYIIKDFKKSKYVIKTVLTKIITE